MDDKLFEERMRSLKQSYEKLPTVSSSDKIMDQIKRQEKPVKKRAVFQLPLVASFIGVLIIGGILGIQLMSQSTNFRTGEEGPKNQPVTNKEIEEAINETRGLYERNLDQLNENLKFEEAEQYRFVQEAKAAVERFEQRKNYESQAELETYRDKVKEIITYRVSMPNEEFELFKKDAVNGEEITESQLYSYLDKLELLHELFFEEWYDLFIQNQHSITDIENYVKQLNDGNLIEGDQEFIELTKTLRAYGYIFFHEGEGGINFKPDYTDVYKSLEKALTEDAKVYLKIKSEKEAFMDGALAISHPELGKRLLEIEEFILKNPSSPIAEELKIQYQYYLASYLLGMNNTSIVIEGEKLKEEIKINFEKLISENKFSETAKVVEEFYQKLKAAQFILTDELRAEEITLPDILKPKVQEYSLEKHLLPTTKEMLARYKSLKDTGATSIYSEPYSGADTSIEFAVARIYMYAISKGDFETAYQLSYHGKGSKLPELEVFIEQMKAAQADYQALSNEVKYVRTNYEETGEVIEHVLIKENGESVLFKMRLENSLPKVEYQPLS
ncbi:hypothetical protein WQ54_22705 [Bacillus sp. SA1-12]|uniref:hypothetical protein n=1 Tax=Bacillus sp. SA1-12 TaxID=1455638 RepID=UPI00062734FD|nr:hypothetical protein [Bacillus sp. SA1-12]KKI89954.1 hypothetical protein WQ54_22705 [Bacillus sp. SA1-12]